MCKVLAWRFIRPSLCSLLSLHTLHLSCNPAHGRYLCKAVWFWATYTALESGLCIYPLRLVLSLQDYSISGVCSTAVYYRPGPSQMPSLFWTLIKPGSRLCHQCVVQREFLSMTFCFLAWCFLPQTGRCKTQSSNSP